MCVEATDTDCRESLRQTAANLAQRAARTRPLEPELDTEGQISVTIEGVRVDLVDCGDPAGLPQEGYAARMFNFFDCPCEIYILAMVYIDRMLEKNPTFVVDAGAVNRLLLTSVVLALKWHEEVCEQYPYSHYARVGGVTMEELRQLEAHFVDLLGWELHVDPCDYLSHGFVAVACKTRALLSSTASSCSTRQGSPALHSADGEDAGTWSDDSDDECLPGRPLWGILSFRKEEEEDECLTGRPLWTVQSYRLQEEEDKEMEEVEDLKEEPDEDAGFVVERKEQQKFKEEEEAKKEKEVVQAMAADETDNECLPGRPLWSTESYLSEAFKQDLEHEADEDEGEENKEDCLQGRPLWSVQSYDAPSSCGSGGGSSNNSGSMGATRKIGFQPPDTEAGDISLLSPWINQVSLAWGNSNAFDVTLAGHTSVLAMSELSADVTCGTQCFDPQLLAEQPPLNMAASERDDSSHRSCPQSSSSLKRMASTCVIPLGFCNSDNVDENASALSDKFDQASPKYEGPRHMEAETSAIIPNSAPLGLPVVCH